MNKQEQALQDFIDKNPKAKIRQHAIDKRLNLCKSNSERLVVISAMMWASVNKFRRVLDGEIIKSDVIEFKPKESL